MALVGTAYVRVKFLQDTVGKDINAAVERGLADVNDKIGSDLGKSVGAGIRESIAESGIERSITDAIEDGIDDADKSTSVDVEADTGTFSAAMKYHTRPRTVPMHLKVHKGSLKVFTEVIRRASGARLLSDWGEKLFRTFARLDQLAPMLGAVVTGLGAVVGLGGSLLGWIGLTSTQLASLAALALPLPAMFIGGAASLGVLIAAMKDLKTELAPLKDDFAGLQDIISSNFWDQARDPIIDMVETLMPMLREQLGGMSTALGSFFASMANSLAAADNMSRLEKIFGAQTKSIENATPGIEKMIDGILRLGAAGSAYLPRIGTWFTDISTRFDEWVKRNEESGQLFVWVEDGIANFKTLWGAIADIGGILGGLGRAAAAAGGGGIYTLAKGLDWLNTSINSVAGQSALTTFFAASEAASTSIGQGFMNLAGSIGASMSTVTTVITIGGRTIGTIFTAIGQIFENPTFQTGLLNLAMGFETFVNSLSGSAGPIGEILGSLGTLVGTFLTSLGPLISTALGLIAPVISTLATALGPVVTILGSTLTGALAGLQPLISALLPLVSGVIGVFADLFAVIGPVVVQLIGQLSPVLAQMVSVILPPLMSLFTSVAGAVGQMVAALAPLVVQLVSGLAPVISGLVAAVLPMLEEAFNAIVPSVMNLFAALGPIIDIFMGIVNVVAPILIPIIGVLISVLGGALKGAIDGIVMVLNGFKMTFDGIVQFVTSVIAGDWGAAWEGLKTAVIGVITMIAGAIWTWMNVTVIGAVRGGVIRVVASFKGLWDDVLGLFSRAYINIYGTLVGWWNSVLAFFKGGMSSMGSTVSNGLNAVKNFFVNSFNSVVSTVSSAFTSVVNFARNGLSGAVSAVSSGLNSMKSAVSSGISTVISLFSGLPSKILGALGNLGSYLTSSGRSLINGFVSGITGGFDRAVSAVKDGLARVRSFFPFSPAKEGPFSGKGYTSFSGEKMIKDFGAGAKAGAGAAQRMVEEANRKILDGMNSVTQQLTPEYSLSMSNAALSAATGSYGGGISNVSTGGDVYQIEEVIMQFQSLTDVDDVKKLAEALRSIPRIARQRPTTRSM